MLLGTHCPLQSRASAIWSALFKFREYHISPLKDSFLPKIGIPSLAFGRTPHETIFFSSLPTPCPPLLFPHTRTTKLPQAIPPVTSMLFYLPHWIRSPHSGGCPFTSWTVCPSSNLKRALQPLMDHQWSLIHQIAGKFTPITLKLSLFMHLAAGPWVGHHCLQPLRSISLLTTILYQDIHCA